MKLATVFVFIATIGTANAFAPFIGPAVDVLVEAIANGLKEHAGSFYVRVVNTMGPDVEVIANCASGDDTIDETKLRDGEAMAWKFNENAASTTEFWCDLSASDGKKKSVTVYKAPGEYANNWYLRGQGIYFGEFDGSQLRKMEDWE